MNKHLHIRLLLLLGCVWLAGVARAEAEPEPIVLPPLDRGAQDAELPEPEALRSAVAFWMRVYLEATTSAGFLHDSKKMGVVYETVRLEEGQGHRARERYVEARKDHWRAALRRIAKGGEPRDQDEENVLRMFSLELDRPPGPADLYEAARRIRFQLGQRNKFRDGIIRSGAYEDDMRAVFRHLGLPEDLAYLPHVESSFNVEAYSKYGAAGIWQFMRSTGRRYLTINYVVDERLDPALATRAAARLLRDNYKALESWPLAITAYNHGATGMRRAKRKLGTDDIGVIASKYRSRTFGFASRNFYAQFLAARRILQGYEPYFGPLRRDSAEVVDEFKLPFYADAADLQRYLGIAPDVIQRYNRSLRRPVFTSGKRIPKDYLLRLPAGTVGPNADVWLAALPEAKRHAEQHRSNYYQVRRGDTLSHIARRHGTSVRKIASLNNLPSRHRIHPGQVLQLPDSGTRTRKKPAPALVSTAHAEPVPQPEPKAKPEPEPSIVLAEPKPAPQPGANGATPAQAGNGSAEPPAEIVIARADPIARRPAPPGERPPALPQDSPWRRVDGDQIIVDADETLGHFADWLNVSTQRLRDLNALSYGRGLRIGQRLKLDFRSVNSTDFLERRMEYHKGIEEDFLTAFRVAGTVEHQLRRGDSIWALSRETYRVPTWLIRRYNPDADLVRLVPGQRLQIPVIESL